MRTSIGTGVVHPARPWLIDAGQVVKRHRHMWNAALILAAP